MRVAAFLTADFLLAAHIRTKRNGDINASVGVKVVFKEGDKHSRRSNNGVVKGVSKIVAVFALYADFKASCLGVAKVRAASYLELFFLSWFVLQLSLVLTVA